METPEDLWATCPSVLISLTLQRSILPFKWSFLYCHWCPLPLVQSLDAAEKSLAFLLLLIRCLYPLVRSPLSLLISRLDNPSSQLLVCQTLQSLHHLGGPSLDSLWYARVCIELGSAKLDPALQLRLSRGKESPPSICWQRSSSRRSEECWAALLPGRAVTHSELGMVLCKAALRLVSLSACAGAWCYSSPGAGFYTFLH